MLRVIFYVLFLLAAACSQDTEDQALGTTCLTEDGMSCASTGDACTIGVCVGEPAVCETRAREDGTPCDDRIAETETSVCMGGVCVGSPSSCSDDAGCSDGNECNGTESCADGSCTGGAPLPNGAACNDRNPDTINDMCMDGLCGGTPGSGMWTPGAMCGAAESGCVYNDGGTCMNPRGTVDGRLAPRIGDPCSTNEECDASREQQCEIAPGAAEGQCGSTRGLGGVCHDIGDQTRPEAPLSDIYGECPCTQVCEHMYNDAGIYVGTCVGSP